MEKGYLRFLIYSFIILVLFSFIQCDKKHDIETEKIQKYLKERYDVKLGSNINKVYIINDMGCGNCILSLSEFVKNNASDSSLIIINSRGLNVDLDGFENKRQLNPNIVINRSVINDPNDLFYHSGVVYMNKEEVDTIINLGSDEIVNQLRYIFSRK